MGRLNSKPTARCSGDTHKPSPFGELANHHRSPIVSFFWVTRTVLAPALAEAEAASQPACPPPTTITSTPVGTSCRRLPATPASPADAGDAEDIMRGMPPPLLIEAETLLLLSLPLLHVDGLGRRTAAFVANLLRPAAVAAVALAVPARLLLATACMLPLVEEERAGESAVGGTKATAGGQKCAATTVAVASTTALRTATSWEGPGEHEEEDEEDEHEIATGLSLRFRVLLCFMGCPKDKHWQLAYGFWGASRQRGNVGIRVV